MPTRYRTTPATPVFSLNVAAAITLTLVWALLIYQFSVFAGYALIMDLNPWFHSGWWIPLWSFVAVVCLFFSYREVNERDVPVSAMIVTLVAFYTSASSTVWMTIRSVLQFFQIL